MFYLFVTHIAHGNYFNKELLQNTIQKADILPHLFILSK